MIFFRLPFKPIFFSSIEESRDHAGLERLATLCLIIRHSDRRNHCGSDHKANADKRLGLSDVKPAETGRNGKSNAHLDVLDHKDQAHPEGSGGLHTKTFSDNKSFCMETFFTAFTADTKMSVVWNICYV